MVFTMVRDSICQYLANERDNQERLALAAGKTQDEVLQEIDFTIYPKRFRIPDVSEMPCVYVYFSRIEYPQDEQAINGNYALANLQVDYYCCGQTTHKRNNNGDKITITADENAEDRLNYLSAQLYKILCSEQSVCMGTNKVVTHSRLKSWQRIISPDELNQAATVLGGSFEFELGFDEPTYYNNLVEIREFYTKLGIKDEFIDPFVRVLLDSNE